MIKRFAYVLSKYMFYEPDEILMISLSMDEIITHFTRELRKLEDREGLYVTRYEFGKSYSNDYAKTIRHIEKENGKNKDLKKELNK